MTDRHQTRTRTTFLLTSLLPPAQVPAWPKTQFGEQDSWARVTESSPAKISAKSEFIVDDAPAVRASGVNNR